MQQMFSNGRYANVTATIALIIALGGTSYAAIKLPANSVGSRQLKMHAVTSSKIAADAVTSASVKNGSLRARDFKGGQLAVGAPGPAGPAGATNIVRRQAGSQPVPAGSVGAVKMACNPGERAITAGLQSDADLLNIFAITESFPITTGDVPTGWYVEAKNSASSSNQFLAFLICAKP